MDAIAASALHIRLDRYSANSRRKRQGGANQVRLQVPSLVDLVHQRVDLLVPGRVEPVRQSPRAIAYGFFAHGTDPHDRPYSSGIVSRADHLCRPPSPAHSAADRSVARLSPRFRYYSAVRRLARRRSPLRLPAYRVADPGAVREPDESSWGHVSIFRTVPSANTLIRWVDENAFAPIVRARPRPTFGRPVHHGDGSPRYGPVLLRKPFGSRLAADTLPSGCPCGQSTAVGTSPWLCPSFPTSCPCRVRHGRVPQPTRHYPRLWIGRPSSGRSRDFNPPDQDAAQHTL